MEYEFSPRNGGFCIGHHFIEKRKSNFLFCQGFSRHEFFQFLDVFIGIKSQAIPFSPVSTGPSGFLVIALYTFWNVVVNHKPDIGFVDPHPKGNGGDNHVAIFLEEHVLIAYSRLGIQARVIRQSIYAIDLQYLCQFLYPLSGKAIDNSGFTHITFYKLDDIGFNLIRFRPYFIIQIGPIKRRLEQLCIGNF